MHWYNTCTSMVTDWYNVFSKFQIKYIGRVQNTCKHLFDANLYRVDEIEYL